MNTLYKALFRCKVSRVFKICKNTLPKVLLNQVTSYDIRSASPIHGHLHSTWVQARVETNT